MTRTEDVVVPTCGPLSAGPALDQMGIVFTGRLRQRLQIVETKLSRVLLDFGEIKPRMLHAGVLMHLSDARGPSSPIAGTTGRLSFIKLLQCVLQAIVSHAPATQTSGQSPVVRVGERLQRFEPAR